MKMWPDDFVFIHFADLLNDCCILDNDFVTTLLVLKLLEVKMLICNLSLWESNTLFLEILSVRPDS